MAVVQELEALLLQAKAGTITGIGYAVVTNERSVKAGLAGVLAKDRLKAAGILLGAASKSVYEFRE